MSYESKKGDWSGRVYIKRGEDEEVRREENLLKHFI